MTKGKKWRQDTRGVLECGWRNAGESESSHCPEAAKRGPPSEQRGLLPLYLTSLTCSHVLRHSSTAVYSPPLSRMSSVQENKGFCTADCSAASAQSEAWYIRQPLQNVSEVGRRESWYTENFLFRLNHIRCKLPELKARNSCYLYSKYFTCFRVSLSASNLGYFLPDSMFLNVLFLIYKKLMFYRKTHIFFSLESWDILESEVSRNEDNGKEIQENIQAARSKSISYYKIFQY